MLTKKLQEAAGNASNPVYIEDVFSTYLYTGTGANQTVPNDIDLSTKGGLVWLKQRNGAGNHYLTDSAVGFNRTRFSNTTDADQTYGVIDALTNGFTDKANWSSGQTVSSWTFRKQPKFFDVVTYTGNGVANRQIPHSLGSVPGCIITKNTTTASNSDWNAWHRSLPDRVSNRPYTLRLNTTEAQLGIDALKAPTSTYFTIGDDPGYANISGVTYVAYIFAHNAGGFGLTGTDNVISCGSFTSDSSGLFSVNLGYEPQWLMIKRVDTTGEWYVQDTMRGFAQLQLNLLSANSSAAENVLTGTAYVHPDATGFSTPNGIYGANGTFIYVAIRRGPMKVPTDATKVFQPVTYTGDGATGRNISTTITPDMVIDSQRNAPEWFTFDRLRGSAQYMLTYSTAVEATLAAGGIAFDYQNGFRLDPNSLFSNNSGQNYATWNFKRAPSFFDEVCYTGNGAGTYLINHNLGVTPEMLIIKDRSVGDRWSVYFPAFDTFMTLNAINGKQNGSPLPSAVTSTTFNVGSTTGYASVAGRENTSGATYVSYLFATCAGVSKVGSYTGNGSSQTINCGFTGGARFVLIKRTDTTGDWYVWDTARGIVSGNDPHLSLNTTNAEVTSNDTIDTDSSGFIVNQVSANNVNVSSATYIFFAVA